MPLTPAIPRPPARSGNRAAHLFEVLDGAAPTRPLTRYSLAGVDEVLLCRGDGPTREGRILRIGLPDRWMSTVHARLFREGASFRVEDSGSTNGTFINGEPMREREIADLDALQVGLTHLLFRSSVPEGALPPAPHPTLATLSPELAARSAVARPGRAAARGAGRRSPGGGFERAGASGPARDRGHPPGPGGCGGDATLPRRPVRAHRLLHPPPAAPAEAARGPRAPDGGALAQARRGAGDAHGRGRPRAAPPSLAPERPRVGAVHRLRPGARGRRTDRPRPSAGEPSPARRTRAGRRRTRPAQARARGSAAARPALGAAARARRQRSRGRARPGKGPHASAPLGQALRPVACGLPVVARYRAHARYRSHWKARPGRRNRGRRGVRVRHR